MPKASVLQFNNYTVEKLHFKSTPVETDQHEFQLHPRFNRELIDLGDNNYDVQLSVDITSTEQHPMPFELSVVIVGHFTYDDTEDSSPELKEAVLRNNTISILFPFLRQIVATLTTTANVATLMLPIMNFNDALKKNKS